VHHLVYLGVYHLIINKLHGSHGHGKVIENGKSVMVMCIKYKFYCSAFTKSCFFSCDIKFGGIARVAVMMFCKYQLAVYLSDCNMASNSLIFSILSANSIKSMCLVFHREQIVDWFWKSHRI